MPSLNFTYNSFLYDVFFFVLEFKYLFRQSYSNNEVFMKMLASIFSFASTISEVSNVHEENDVLTTKACMNNSIHCVHSDARNPAHNR